MTDRMFKSEYWTCEACGERVPRDLNHVCPEDASSNRAANRSYEIRTMHPWGFRTGEWAKLLTKAPSDSGHGDCYVVQFPDGVTDFWVIGDPRGEYEFREAGPR